MEDIFDATIVNEMMLHEVMAKLLVKIFGDCFDPEVFVVERSLKTRWVIGKHLAKKWCLELQCECLHIEEDTPTMLGLTREATLRLPPEDDHPAVMISMFFPESDVRLPLWIFDWKVNGPPHFNWGQAHAYGFQALRHNRSVLSHFNCVRTSVLDHETSTPGALTTATWNISVHDDDFQFRNVPFITQCEGNFPQFIREVYDWCHSQALWVMENNSVPKPFQGVRWFPTLVTRFGFKNGTFQPGRSDRSTVFKCTKEGKIYWAKYLIKETQGFAENLLLQTRIYEFMQTELKEMHHKKLKRMLPFREIFSCSEQVALEITRDIGETNSRGGGPGLTTAKQIIKFIFRMLAMTQIDFKKLGARDFYWHADLRPSNVNAKGQVIDFEFLTVSGRRVGKNIELTKEQQRGFQPSKFTAAWQIAMLLVCVFAKNGAKTAKKIRKACEKNEPFDNYGIDLSSILPLELREDVRSLIFEFARPCVYHFMAVPKYDIAAKLKARYDQFAKYVDGGGTAAVSAAWEETKAKRKPAMEAGVDAERGRRAKRGR